MAAISRANQLHQLLPGLNALFGEEYQSYDNEHEQIYSTENSDRSFEEELKISGFGAAPVKAEGSQILYDTAQESFVARYTHETIAMGFAVTEEAMEDNLYVSLSGRYTKALARAMAYTKQVKAMAPLNLGFTTFNSGDGVSLFNTAHPLVSGGTNANRPAVGADLNEASLEDAIIQIGGWTDERGLKIAAQARKLIVPSALQFVATRLLKSEYQPGSANNDVNAIVSTGVLPEGFAVNNYVTDTNAFYLMTDVPDGMKHFVRSPMQTSMDGDFNTGNVRYKARERYSFGVSDPLGIFGSPGSS